MRIPIISFTLIVLTLAVVAVPAQQRLIPGVDDKTVRPGMAFSNAEAVTTGSGVLIRWRVEHETGNTGYRIYRIGRGGEIDVELPSVLGSNAGEGERTAPGGQYQTYDRNGSIGDAYRIEIAGDGAEGKGSCTVTAVFTDDLSRFTNLTIDQLNDKYSTRKQPLVSRNLGLPKDLAEESAASQFAPDPVNQKWVAAQPGVKLGIRSNAFYRVTRAELQAAGFDVDADPTLWRLYTDGVEQAINVGPAGEYVEFYGTARETIETDLRYYYLLVGPSTGKRMATRVSRPLTSTVISPDYRENFYAKERIYYVYDILNGDAENFWGNVVSPSGSTFNFNLTGVRTQGPDIAIQIKFQAYSSGAHSIALALNGTPIPTAAWSGTTPFTRNATLPLSALVNGSNSLSMTVASGSDLVLFDSVEVGFSRSYLADQGRATFYTQNYRGATVTGFSGSDIRLFDITAEGDPIEVINLTVEADGPGLALKLPSHRGRVFHVIDTSGVRSVPSITRNYPSSLSKALNRGSLLIVTPSQFSAGAEAWSRYRSQQGIETAVVDVDDIFDEFSYGQPAADAINAFLKYAYQNWQLPPQYVLLLGDASYDPKNYEGLGFQNIIPTKMVNTLYIETGSDEALADFNNDGLAELSIGRIPAKTQVEVSNALAKVEAFEQPAMQDLGRGAIYAYDLPSGYDFEGMSIQLRNLMPVSMPAVMVDRGAPGSAATLLNEINNGRYIVNYAGHGTSGIWGSNAFFSVSTVPLLTNANSRSIFTMLTCLNGYFVNPNFDALAELLLKAENGGAVASWASTGSTNGDVQLALARRFYMQVAAGNITRMGDLVRDAKSVIPGNRDVRLSWVLLGDPMLKIR